MLESISFITSVRLRIAICATLGIQVGPAAERPYITWPKAQGNIANVSAARCFNVSFRWKLIVLAIQDLREAGRHCYANVEPKNVAPTLIVVVLPEGAANLYREIKQ